MHWDVCYLCKPIISYFFPFLKFSCEWQLEVNINNAVTIQNTEHFEMTISSLKIQGHFVCLDGASAEGSRATL